MRVKVDVTLRSGILDPQGSAVKNGLLKLGFGEVKDVRIGKVIYLKLDSTQDIDARIKEMCEKLLVNEVIEDYTYIIEDKA